MSEFNVSQVEIDCVCQEALPPMVIHGLELFNQGEYFEAHEVLESAWRAERGPIRELYRGILQVAVAYYHALRGNYVGSLKLFLRSRTWLAPFPDQCQSIDLAGFRQDYQRVEESIRSLGPQGIAQFDRNLLKPIHYTHQGGNA